MASTQALSKRRARKNVLIGTWNIALLGDCQKQGDGAQGLVQRNLTDVCCIAEVIAGTSRS